MSCILLMRLLLLVNMSTSLHLTGKWKSKDFFKLLSKFAFQQTDLNDKTNTQGYIYGSVLSEANVSTPLQLVVLDKMYFLEYYGNRTVVPRTDACQAMFKKIDNDAWDYTCNPLGREDFLRKIPCAAGRVCVEEDKPKKVVYNYQFTYGIQDTSHPRFWYVSMASCYRNTTNHQCKWYHNSEQDVILDYDVWLVNGNPYTKHINPFEHQFSFEMHGVFEIYAVFLLLFIILLSVQMWSLRKRSHAITKLLTVCIAMEFTGISLNFVHILKFALDGEGVIPLRILGNVIDMLAECLLMLLLMLICKGWTITRPIVTNKILLIIVWTSYTIVNGFLFIWNLEEIDVISDIDEWQTWPGYLTLSFRVVIMLWFLYELQLSLTEENNKDKLRFYLHFGAGFLVWFIYLPIAALIGTTISALYRYKTILSITFGADFLAFLVLVHLLWPSHSDKYFNLVPKTNGTVGIVQHRHRSENIEMTALLVSDSEEEIYQNHSSLTTTVNEEL